jgi:hypothetical protein
VSAIYSDAYLARFVTPEIEARAESEIATHGTFSDEWVDRLLPPQAYVIICLEQQGAPDDMFSAKLKSYQKELDRLLSYARTATPDADGNVPAVFSVPIERA